MAIAAARAYRTGLATFTTSSGNGSKLHSEPLRIAAIWLRASFDSTAIFRSMVSSLHAPFLGFVVTLLALGLVPRPARSADDASAYQAWEVRSLTVEGSDARIRLAALHLLQQGAARGSHVDEWIPANAPHLGRRKSREAAGFRVGAEAAHHPVE